MDDGPILIDYDAMERQFAAAVEAVPPERRLARPPASSYRKGKLTIELASDVLPRDSFFTVLELLGKYMRSFREFQPSFNGASVVADVFTELQRKPPRTGSATTTLPAPFQVSFAFDPNTGGGTIKFDKDSLLMQEEINCVLDVWRKIGVDEAGEAGAADPATVVPFDALVAQLARATEADLANVGAAQRNGSPPLVTLRKGVLVIEMQFASLSREAFFPVLEIASKYSRAFTELKPASFRTSVVMDVNSPFRKKRGGKIELAFDFDSRGSGKLVMQKDSLLIQEEINCVLEIWRKLAIKHSAEDTQLRDPRTVLADLGAVVFDPDPKYSPERIAGYERTKRDVYDTVVLPLLDPSVFVEIAKLTRGVDKPSIPRAVLFEGPPGTGKTTMARVIATQANVPMVYVPVESIMSKWFGESERRLDAIFDLAGAFPRSIVFLDEIDAFAGSRAGQIHEATRRILSVLLRQMQGLVETSNVMVVGATNRAVDLDAALLNRFARTIEFPLPNTEERAAILRNYARQLSSDDLAKLAAATEGASGRRLEDGCGAAERVWASKLIVEKAAISPPPVDIYLAAFTR